MTDYTRVLEHIKVSEAKVAGLSKEIKDVEAKIKTLDGEIEIMKAKEKQLKEELVYKNIIVNEKEWELQGLKRNSEIWTNMHKEKQIVYDTKNEELRSMQQNVWETRILFYDTVLEFIDKNDFLMNNDSIENIIKYQREKNKLLESINKLESNINETENKYGEQKGRYDLLNHLEKEKESLLEHEYSADFIRLKNKIDFYTKDLESLETELAKCSGRATSNHCELMMIRKSQRTCEDIESTAFQSTVVQPTETSAAGREDGNLEDCGKKQTFKPKVPSFLLRKPSTPSTIDKA